jgi:hypothetical protein
MKLTNYNYILFDTFPHFSWTNLINAFRYEIIFHISITGRFLYNLERKNQALLFLPHFNNSSTPVGYCKSLTNIRNLFWYEIIFHISVCGSFQYDWTKIVCSSFPSTFQSYFHPCRIFQISSKFMLNKFQKYILIWNYHPLFSLWKISVWLGNNCMLLFSFHISIILPHL